jgi:hypothetical protein
MNLKYLFPKRTLYIFKDRIFFLPTYNKTRKLFTKINIMKTMRGYYSSLSNSNWMKTIDSYWTLNFLSDSNALKYL